MTDTLRCPKCQLLLPEGGICPSCAADFLDGEPTLGPAEPFVPPIVAELAEKFHQLEILELIGKGGMGAVYKARQRELDRIVALKILPPGIGEDPAFAERFAREARALAKLSHPNIVTLFEFGRADGGPYFFLMEFVDGVNLRQLLLVKRVSPREALEIVPQICDALQFAHDHGIVHRDIKPENILLDRRGRVKVADFGLAKLIGAGAETPGEGIGAIGEATEAGKILGTPSYMAPEQTEHPDMVDHRADIYALGVVFYQMLTGELPEKSLQPPSSRMLGVRVDVRLDEVVLRALEKNPDRRYAQASVMKTQVEAVAAAKPVHPPRSSRLRFVGWGLTVVALLLLAGGILSMERARKERVLTQELSQAIRQALAAANIQYDQLGLRTSTGGIEGTVIGPKKLQKIDGRVVSTPLKGKLIIHQTANGWMVRGTEDLSDIAITRSGATTLSGPGANVIPPRKSRSLQKPPSVATFGPVIERVVANEGLIDLDSGKTLVELPKSVSTADELVQSVLEVFAWMEREGMDAIHMPASRGLLTGAGIKGLDMKIKALSSEDWDRLTPEQLRAALAAVEVKKWQHLLSDDESPKTYAFQTREGGAGILQITGITDDPPHVNVRYKLVKKETLPVEHKIIRFFSATGDEIPQSEWETVLPPEVGRIYRGEGQEEYLLTGEFNVSAAGARHAVLRPVQKMSGLRVVTDLPEANPVKAGQQLSLDSSAPGKVAKITKSKNDGAYTIYISTK